MERKLNYVGLQDYFCSQCNGVGKLFLRNGKYFDCDICKGTGQDKRNLLWITQGEIMKAWRVEQEITLRGCAKEFEIDPSNLSKMERGLMKPDPRYLKNIMLTL